jgi:hypothetical protein
MCFALRPHVVGGDALPCGLFLDMGTDEVLPVIFEAPFCLSDYPAWRLVISASPLLE